MSNNLTQHDSVDELGRRILFHIVASDRLTDEDFQSNQAKERRPLSAAVGRRGRALDWHLSLRIVDICTPKGRPITVAGNAHRGASNTARFIHSRAQNDNQPGTLDDLGRAQ
jgi:hypothetical protein